MDLPLIEVLDLPGVSDDTYPKIILEKLLKTGSRLINSLINWQISLM